MKKKAYKTPEIRSEKLEMGVFGIYGGTSQPVEALEPYFGLCCS